MLGIPPTLNHPLGGLTYLWTDNFIWLDDTSGDLNDSGWLELEIDDSIKNNSTSPSTTSCITDGSWCTLLRSIR